MELKEIVFNKIFDIIDKYNGPAKRPIIYRSFSGIAENTIVLRYVCQKNVDVLIPTPEIESTDSRIIRPTDGSNIVIRNVSETYNLSFDFLGKDIYNGQNVKVIFCSDSY